MKSALLLVVMMMGAILGGCGQKGPLLLPDAPKHKRAVPNPRAPTAPPASSTPSTPTTPTP